MGNKRKNNVVKKEIITEQQENRRIDNYLRSQTEGIPKSRIYQMIRRGEVRINSKRIKPAYRLIAGDIIRIPPILTTTKDTLLPPDKKLLQQIRNSIIYEDKKCMVLNKPSGLVVHSGTHTKYGIIECLRLIRKDIDTLHLVHRLDKDTSGCLLIAKCHKWLRDIHKMLRTGQIEKHYITLLKGQLIEQEKMVSIRLKRNILSSGESLVVAEKTGKDSVSYFKALAFYQKATLVDVKLLTGRTHQIRVHANHIQHPIAGDQKYGDKQFNKILKKLGLKRLFLHAKTLTFNCPNSRKLQRFESPIPSELSVFLTRLE